MAKSFDIQGYNFTGYGTDVFGTTTAGRQLGILSAAGTNAVAIVPNFYMDTINSNVVFANEITPSDADVLAGIKAAQAAGLDVLLKPHVDPLDGIWRAYMEPEDPAAWFESYKNMLVDYAKIAQQTGLKMMSIGTELASMTGENYRAEWLSIIEAVRAVFKGELTYSAEWGEARTLSFWDKLDSIGVDGYFPLSVADKAPSVAELKFSWMHPSANEDTNDILGGLSPVDYLRSLSDGYGKNILFTEIGFRPIDGAATSPGDWEMNGKLNEKAQANLFEAMFEVFGSQGGDWFSGFYIWDRRAEDETVGKDYHTEGRPAQKIIDLWYGLDDRNSKVPDTGMTVYGTGRTDEMIGGVGGTRIVAGDGDDMLAGGGGNDILIGGGRSAAGDTSMVELAGFGDPFKGAGAKFKVLVNGDVVGQGEAGAGSRENWDLDRFAFSFDTPAQFQTIEIEFINDGGNAKKDRNLYISHIEINGEVIDLGSADNDQEPGTGALYANGAFSVNLGPQNAALMPDRSDVDILFGGLGADRLTGGSDSDTFLYRSEEEIKGDLITDFQPSIDKIDLSALDAIESLAGDQAFVWIGEARFTGVAGELSYVKSGRATVISGDTDGDGVADFALHMKGGLTLDAGDLVL